MKLSRIFLGAFAGSLLLASGALAQEEKAKLNLPETVTVAGQQLTPGEYKLTWNGTGPSVELKIVKGKQVVTVPARVVQEANTTISNSYGARKEADGSRTLTTIYFSGKKYNLEIAGAQSASTENSSAVSK